MSTYITMAALYAAMDDDSILWLACFIAACPVIYFIVWPVIKRIRWLLEK